MNAHWLERLNALLFRLRHVWAVGSFSLGLASYFLVERQPWLAAVLTAVLVATWLVLITENLWLRRFRGTPMEQVAQGALAIECRADDTETIAVLRAIQHADTRRVVDTERAFLHELGGDCDLPAGAHATLGDDGIEITGMLASLDGRVLIRERRVGTDPDQLGRAVARFLLDERGGRDLLADLR